MAYFEGIEMTGGYGNGPDIISSCSVEVNKGEIVSILGPNGAGKSTAMKAMLGLLNLKSGSVMINGKDISKLSPQDRVKEGISFVPQTKNVFAGMTVEENLEMGAFLINALLKPNLIKKEEDIIRAKAYEVTEFLNLKHLANERAGNLSGGQKKLLELGRTMMVDAKLVLLDEVGAGVNRTLLKDLGTAILRLNKEKNYTFCMIEHDMDFIGRLCDPVIVMAEGSVLFEGSVEDAKKDEKVIESYLGRGSKLKDN